MSGTPRGKSYARSNLLDLSDQAGTVYDIRLKVFVEDDGMGGRKHSTSTEDRPMFRRWFLNEAISGYEDGHIGPTGWTPDDGTHFIVSWYRLRAPTLVDAMRDALGWTQRAFEDAEMKIRAPIEMQGEVHRDRL